MPTLTTDRNESGEQGPLANIPGYGNLASIVAHRKGSVSVASCQILATPHPAGRVLTARRSIPRRLRLRCCLALLRARQRRPLATAMFPDAHYGSGTCQLAVATAPTWAHLALGYTRPWRARSGVGHPGG